MRRGRAGGVTGTWRGGARLSHGGGTVRRRRISAWRAAVLVLAGAGLGAHLDLLLALLGLAPVRGEGGSGRAVCEEVEVDLGGCVRGGGGGGGGDGFHRQGGGNYGGGPIVVGNGGGGDGPGATTLFVGDLHWWTTDADLEAELVKYGHVKEVRFFDEKASGKSKGYCQVDFFDPGAAAACKEGMNGHLFNGRPCVVAFASPNTVRRMGEAQMKNNQSMGQQNSGRHLAERRIAFPLKQRHASRLSSASLTSVLPCLSRRPRAAALAAG